VNASDILKYGDSFFKATLEGVPESEWETPNVCGVWSVKDIVAHLASFEVLLNEILQDFIEPGSVATPLRDLIMRDHGLFNDQEVGKRQGMTMQQLLAEYEAGHQKNMELIQRVPHERLIDSNAIPWYYGGGYSMDDYLVYTYYGHKREHGAQIDVFKDVLKRREQASAETA
jgi:hypothetical protein